MFALCHFKDNEINFVLYDKNDIKELAEHMNIEIEKEISFEEMKKDYSFYPIISANDLILRSLNSKSRTNSHVLDELGISRWINIENEWNKIQDKKSKLSKSQRDRVEDLYNFITSLS